MKPIHPESQLVPLTKYDLFGVPPTQTTSVFNFVTEHRPLSSPNGLSYVQFEISSAMDEYIVVQDMELYMRFKIHDTQKLPDLLAGVGTANNLMHSMIKQIDIQIGDRFITESTNTYHYKAYFETLLGYSKSAKSSHLSSVGWCAEDDKTKLPNLNSRKLIMRTEWEFKEIELCGALFIDLTGQPKVLLGGTKMTIKIHFNKPELFMTSIHFIDPVINFEELKLLVPREKVNTEVVAAHNMVIGKCNAKYPIVHSRVRSFLINKGTHDITLDNVHIGQLPRRILLAFVHNTSFNGDFKQNPYNFQHFYVEHIAVYHSALQTGPRVLTMDFENDKYLMAYKALFNVLSQDGPETSFELDRYDYKNGNAIFAFDFSQDKSEGYLASGHSNHLLYGSLRIDLKFRDPLTETVTALIYFEYDKLLEIDQHRNAYIEF